MLHQLISMAIGSALTLLAVAIVIRIRKPIMGDTLFISIDPRDRALLAAGKVCNGRMSNIKELANSAHGDVGLEVLIKDKF